MWRKLCFDLNGVNEAWLSEQRCSGGARRRACWERRAGAEQRFQLLDPARVGGDQLRDLALALLALDHRADGAGDRLRDVGQRLLLVPARDRAVRPRADQEIADRLLFAPSSGPAARGSGTACRTARRCRSYNPARAAAPSLDLLGSTVRASRARSPLTIAALRTARTPRVDARQDLVEHLAAARRSRACRGRPREGRREAGTGSSGIAFPTSAAPVPGSD